MNKAVMDTLSRMISLPELDELVYTFVRDIGLKHTNLTSKIYREVKFCESCV